MSDKVEFAYTSNIGKRRANNEDNFWVNGELLPMINTGTEGVSEGASESDALFYAGVFDGMGGERCGEAASYFSAEEFGRYCKEEGASFDNGPEKFIRELCKSMNQKVLDYAEQESIGSMGSTAAMVFVHQSGVYAANLGDSRIFRYGKGRLERVSVDHVLTGNFLGKAPLTQFLGLHEEEGFYVDPSIRKLRYGESFRVLLCSDGLTDMVTEEQITKRFEEQKSLKETVELLLSDALENGGKDNVTILLLEVPENQSNGFLGFLKRFFGKS